MTNTTKSVITGGRASAVFGGLAVLALTAAACDKAAAPPPSAETTTHGARVDADGRHRVIFELTTDDKDQWESVLNNAENVRKALGADKTDVEIVGHGGGLSMMTLAANATLRPRMEELSHAGVVFAACENTMKKKNVTKEDLLPFAKPVDSGVAEVVRKEEAGWAYLKSSK
jgi:intracellular sulfur oxidation DsrE/DsrF family protein